MTAERLDSDAADAIRKAREAQEKLVEAGAAGLITEGSATPTNETFIELTGLPSKGLFYKTPLKGQALKVEDILLLSNFDESNVQEKFHEIFSRRIKGALPREIMACDELFLAFWLRKSAFPDLGFPTIGHVCENPECGFENPPGSVHFDINDIEFDIKNFDEISKEFLESNGKIKVTLPSKKEYTISLRKRGHIDRYREVLKKDYFANGIKVPDGMEELLTLAAVLNVGVEDIRDTVRGLKELSPVDFVTIMKKVKHYSLIEMPTIKMPCVKCQEVTPVLGYIFLPSTFFPIDQL